ncbi:MAG: hypothetical protein V5A84_02850 [Planctomycetota bacterium]
MDRKQARLHGPHRRGGFALPAAIIMLVVAMLSCGAFLSVAFHEYNLSVHEEQDAKAFYLAQGGIQRTLNLASNTSSLDSMPSDPYTEEPLGDGTYSVQVTNPDSDTAVIVSTGRIMDRSRIIRQTISRD